MSLIDKKKFGTAEPKRRVSLVALWLRDLPEEEREAAKEMLRDPSWPTSSLLRAFQEEGLPEVKYSAFRTFRATNYPEGLSA